ncbi:Gfo/Idh/MocA family oxidoreductase [bacterium]|nr:Gfo/Idh/MocA family oxidoreductase [bacterium]
MERKVIWGILSTAKIGLEKVIPAMQKGSYSQVTAIASRSMEKAQIKAKALGIPKAYGSYEALLSDQEIEAVYIPLPNHMHVEWTLKSLEAGKHVLCEKPIGLNYTEAQHLQKMCRGFSKLKVMEAFMYRHHPQWQKAKKLIDEKAIGELKCIDSFFSYHNDNLSDIRNQIDKGGGGLLDIGCYCISLSRFLFNSEPSRVFGTVEYDPRFKIDRLASGILDFGKGTSSFTCATQLMAHQRVHIFGTKGKIEIEIPFNAPSDKPCKLFVQTGNNTEEIIFDVANQYTIQGDLFSQAILNHTDVPTPLEDGVANMKVIDGIIKSSQSGMWFPLTS